MARTATRAATAAVTAALTLLPATAATAAGSTVVAGSTVWSTANSVATGDQDVPSVAANRNGYVAVVWEDDRDTGDAADTAHSEIYLRLFRDGVPVYEIKLSGAGTSGVAWRHIAPDVGLDDRGNAVVVWADDPDGNGFYNVPYRVVTPAGTVHASSYANASAAGQQLWPKVSVDPDGTPNAPAAVAFTVVWEDIQGSAPATVRAAGYTNITTKVYEVTASHATGAHRRPDVAVGASGDAVAVWDSDADANGFDNIGLTRLAKANGAVNLSRRTANADGGGQQRRAVVAANFAGDFAVAWESDHSGTAGVWTRSFAAAGNPRHGDIEISAGAGAAAPSIGVDDQGNTVLGWTVLADPMLVDPMLVDPDTWIRGLGPDGTAAGRLPAQRLSQTSTGRQEGAAVAVSPWSEVGLAYTDDNDGNTFDQVILGLGLINAEWVAALKRRPTTLR